MIGCATCKGERCWPDGRVCATCDGKGGWGPMPAIAGPARLTLYTVTGPVGRSHSTTSETAAKRTEKQWREEGYATVISERPYEPVVQDRAYWLSIYPDGNFPEGI